MQLQKYSQVEEMVPVTNTRSDLCTSGDQWIMSSRNYGPFHVVQVLENSFSNHLLGIT